VTAISYRDADGNLVRWSAREHRKAEGDRRGLTWWIGLLFAIGSTCFVVGPIPAYEQAVGAHLTAVTYFVGSLFFTTAAYLGYVQVLGAVRHRWIGWEPGVMGFWAAGIQLVGTLYFNVTTFASMFALDQAQAHRVIWRPDASRKHRSCYRPGPAGETAEAAGAPGRRGRRRVGRASPFTNASQAPSKMAFPERSARLPASRTAPDVNITAAGTVSPGQSPRLDV
jgi:hypothetical protein